MKDSLGFTFAIVPSNLNLLWPLFNIANAVMVVIHLVSTNDITFISLILQYMWGSLLKSPLN